MEGKGSKSDASPPKYCRGEEREEIDIDKRRWLQGESGRVCVRRTSQPKIDWEKERERGVGCIRGATQEDKIERKTKEKFEEEEEEKHARKYDGNENKHKTGYLNFVCI